MPLGLDVYAGPLIRYYAGLWKTMGQQAAEAMGLNYRTIYEAGEPQRPSPDEARHAIVAWQAELQAATGWPGRLWLESEDAAYYTQKPDWDGYWALLYLAAADEFPDVPPPTHVPPPSELPDPMKHPLMKHVDAAYRPKAPRGLTRLLGRGGEPPPGPRRYPQLLLQPALWLPFDFEEPFQGRDPSGANVTIGSSAGLRRELESLNARTFRADDAMLDKWDARGPSDSDFTLRRVAQFGLAVFLLAARYSVDQRVPLKLDY